MNSFLVAARVVLPMAITMAVGVGVRIAGITDRPTMKKVNQLVGKVCLPLLMFKNVYTTDFTQFRGAGYFLYAAVCLAILFLFMIVVLPRLMKDPPAAAAMGQALLRPNYILFGAAVAESIYGEGNIGIIMLMGAFAVPLFNAMSVIILEIGRNSAASPRKLFLSICKNQIVQATLLALALKALNITLPTMLEDVCYDLAGIATPLSFLSLGVSLDIRSVGQNRKRLSLGILGRLGVIPAVFVGTAIALGFRGQELCSLFLLFATPTAVASFPLAVSMDADGELAGQMVIFSTICCLPTIFVWVLGLSGFGLI